MLMSVAVVLLGSSRIDCLEPGTVSEVIASVEAQEPLTETMLSYAASHKRAELSELKVWKPNNLSLKPGEGLQAEAHIL